MMDQQATFVLLTHLSDSLLEQADMKKAEALAFQATSDYVRCATAAGIATGLYTAAAQVARAGIDITQDIISGYAK